jgi:hypothetical protein
VNRQQLLTSVKIFNNKYLVFILIFCLFSLICWRQLDPDFGWHLQSGNYIREHGIPQRDIYTYTALNFPWINHEWANDVVDSFVMQYASYGVLAFIFGLLWTGALFLASRKRYLIVLFIAVAALSPYAGVRPIAWSAFLFALLIKILESKNQKIKFLVPPLFLVWANLHAGFVIGLALIAYWIVRKRQKQLLPILTLAILATFINPYSVRLYDEISRTLFDRSLHAQIREWNNFNIPKTSWLFIVIWAAGFWHFEGKKFSSWFKLAPLTLLGSLSAARNTPFFVITSLRDVESYIQHVKRLAPKKLDRQSRALITVSVVIVIAISAYSLKWTVIGPGREANYPSQAVNYLSQHPCQGNLFNDYDYGGYLIWKLPKQKVYIDGRMPSWKDKTGKKYIDRFFDVLANKNRQAEFARYNIRCVLVENGKRPLINSLSHEGWKKIRYSHSTLLLKNN